MRQEVNQWAGVMLILAISCFILKATSKWMFSIVSANITLNVRKDLYGSMLKKHIGWHDSQDNAAGVLTAILASDVETLKGVSSEAAGAMLEAACSLFVGVALGFIICWPVALVACVWTPFLMIGASIQAKVDK